MIIFSVVENNSFENALNKVILVFELYFEVGEWC